MTAYDFLKSIDAPVKVSGRAFGMAALVIGGATAGVVALKAWAFMLLAGVVSQYIGGLEPTSFIDSAVIVLLFVLIAARAKVSKSV